MAGSVLPELLLNLALHCDLGLQVNLWHRLSLGALFHPRLPVEETAIK